MERSKCSYIMLIDMDSFFVNVERIKDPSLTGKPVIVGGEPRARGVVTCASYEARRYGIKAAMPLVKAKKLCPHAVFRPVDWENYSFYSNKVMKLLHQFTPDMEQVSIDEAYLDMNGTERLWGHPCEVASRIQALITHETGLDATIGLGSNKLIAKIAADCAKPKGMLWILPEYESSFLSYLTLDKIPGVGPKTASIFNELNIFTAKQLLSIPADWIKNTLGNNALAIYHRAQGKDDSMVNSGHELPKSIGKEITFTEDTEDLAYLESVLHYMIEELCIKLRTKKMMCGSMTLKLRYSDFLTISKSCKIPSFSSLSYELFPRAKILLMNSFKRRTKVRLLGISVSHLAVFHHQSLLFPDQGLLKWMRLSPHIDKIRKKYGFHSLMNGDIIAIK